MPVGQKPIAQFGAWKVILALVGVPNFDEGFVTQVSAGVNYSDRTKSKEDNGFFLTLNGFPDRIGVPSGYEVAPTSLSFIGLGDVQSYDSFGLYNDGFYQETSENLTTNGRSINTWSVSEKITTAFVKADFATELSGMPVTGNIGLQYVDTDQSSIGNAVTNVDGFVQNQRATGGANFSEVLPSLNLALSLSDNQLLRLGLVMSFILAMKAIFLSRISTKT